MTNVRLEDTMLSDFFADSLRGTSSFVAKSALSNKTGESSNTLPTVTDTYYRSYAYGKYYYYLI